MLKSAEKEKKTYSKKIAQGGKKKRKADSQPRLLARVNREAVLVISLLALMAAQMIYMARVKSVTMDEPNHIARGVTYLRLGDLRLGRLHPPLINLVSALPVAMDSSVALPLDSPYWERSDLGGFANEFLWKANTNTQSILFRARLPIIALALLLALVVYAWARELYGKKAGLLALTLTAFSPNILAHGSLATNDLGFTFFAVLSAYTFWRWLRQPDWKRAMIASLCFGLAMATKYSAFFLIPALPLTAIAYWMTDPAEEKPLRKILRFSAWLVVIALAGALTVWAVYGFRVGQIKGEGWTLPAPAYIAELKVAANRIEKGNPTFLLGSHSRTGWWYYFPVTFAVKTPLPTLALIFASLVYVCRKRVWRDGLPLLIPVAIYFAGSMMSPLNIGYRHLLPALAFLIIFASQMGEVLFKAKSKLVWGAVALIVWLTISVGSTFPHHLAYFNEAIGGMSNSYKVLVDSNLDWGQDLIGLKEYMQREGIEKVKLSYFGSAEPGVYQIDYEPLPGYPRYQYNQDIIPPVLSNPEPGVYAISATCLQGGFFSNKDLFKWFRDREPDAVIGHSIFIYRHKR
ncbi:MAG: glycosyltransferase family 39 protein [Acidobacteriota bacterium]